MRQLTLLFVFACCSCQQVKKQEIVEQPETILPETNTSQTTTLEEFKTLDTIIPFSGYWLSESYYNAIKQNGSPKEAQAGESDYIFIPERTSMPTMMIYGFHEGSNKVHILKNGNVFQIWDMESETKQYDIQLIPENKIRIHNGVFVKIMPEEKRRHIPLVLEEILFKGQYLLNGDTIEFTNKGEIKGMENITQYEVMIDYNDVGRNIDQLTMGQSKDQMINYAFKFINDTLNIYQLSCEEYYDDGCAVYDFGELVYKMEKIN